MCPEKDDALVGISSRLQTKSIPVEPQRSLQVVHAERDEADAWFHGLFSVGRRKL
jgi:hypothetical protein